LRKKASSEKHEARLFGQLCVKYQQMRRRHPHLTHTEIVRPMARGLVNFTTKSRLREAGVDVAPIFCNVINKECEKIDRSLSAHVLSRAKTLKKEGFPKAITRAVLTRGHEHAGQVGILSGHLPRTQAAFKASVEDRTAWRRRLRGLTGPTPRVTRKQQRRETNLENFSFVHPLTDVESVQQQEEKS